MPFKSEKQRKYLWANEPEIARDWTDTYGSGIQAAQGGRIGFYRGSDRHAGTGTTTQSSKTQSGSGRSRIQSDRQADFKANPKNYKTVDRGGNLPSTFGERSRANFVNRNKYKSLVEAGVYPKPGGPIWAKALAFMNPPKEVGMYDEDDIKNLYAGGADPKGLAGLRKDLEYRDQGQQHFQDYYDLNQPDTGGGGGEGGQIPWWLRQQAPVAAVDDTPTTQTASTLGGGHFQVPLEYVVGGKRAAEGGIIGSVGGTSRQKYQMGNMVEGEIEGAEMEGAMMQSEEVIKELYDALIAQGLSPQEAMEKIKEIIASSQTEGPQSPMMGEEFPGQEFGRAPAAFGGIMDTYTGRRKYGLGSFIKKAVGKVKKLASSKLGKLALMYAAGTYLGGMEGFGGSGYGKWFGKGALDPTKGAWKKFGTQLLNPMGEEGIANVGRTAMNYFKGSPQTTGEITAANVGPVKTSYGSILTGKDALKAGGKELAGKSDWSKWILPASLAAGAYTAMAPVEELDDSQSEWDADKAKWDAYYAGLGGDYRVPSNLRLAQGGRIGAQEGGLMNLGGMEKDYRNDGGFVPIGGQEKADDVPARLSRNEFVFTADAVRNAGGGDIDRGAEVMENVMKNLEGGGRISEESQGQGAQEMFEVSERLSEVM
jgi:hypothetical protein